MASTQASTPVDRRRFEPVGSLWEAPLIIAPVACATQVRSEFTWGAGIWRTPAELLGSSLSAGIAAFSSGPGVHGDLARSGNEALQSGGANYG